MVAAALVLLFVALGFSAGGGGLDDRIAGDPAAPPLCLAADLAQKRATCSSIVT